jgi:hypothetical protein
VTQLKKFFISRKNLKPQHWSWLVLILLAGFSIWLMFFTFGYKDDQFVMRSRLWSDFAAHLPLIRSFSLGKNFPVEYPQFAGEPIRYHFLFYLLVGFLEKLGFNLAFALNLLSALGFFGLLTMIYFIAGKLAAENSLTPKKKNKIVIIAGILAVFLFLFNSSLTFVDYFQEHSLSFSSITAIPQNDQFVNFGPWNGDDISAFWHWNVYTNQRHLAFSIALGLMAIWPLVSAGLSSAGSKKKTKFFAEDIILSKKNKMLAKKIGLFGLWFSLILLPFFNLAAYVMTVIFIAAWLLLNPRLIKSYGLFYGLNILFSLPSFYYYWRLGGSSIAFAPGFLAEDKTWLGIVYYWWRNLGFYMILWPLLFIASNLQQKKWWLIFSFYFLLANLFQLSTDMINNHKLVNFFQIGVACLLGAKFAGYWVKSAVLKILIILLLVPLTLSGFIDGAAIINDHQSVVTDPAAEPLGKWLLANTPPDSVFLTTHYLYNPASLVGRKTYLDYGYFAWSMGYDYAPRRVVLRQAFSVNINHRNWCQLMTEENLDYVLISPGKGDLDLDVRQSWLVQNFQPVYISPDEYLVFEVGKICGSD